ncbi:uncharacterized protein LOC114259985 [Camellia sinensis]|uniref:uncharacterized protein LOC114259985 n=1 Tax=Camellia sinensis TaxID=4442 RepID=UPI00103657B5|nr:uncharacterized protein LOC114259985 [Camellia sinensis]
MRRVGPESRGSHHPELKVPFVSILLGASPAFPIEVSLEYSPTPAQQFPASLAYAPLPPEDPNEDPDEDPEEDPKESFDLGLGYDIGCRKGVGRLKKDFDDENEEMGSVLWVSGPNAQVIGRQRPWTNKSGGATGENRKVGPTGNQKATGRVFALQEKDDEDPLVIRGNIVLYNSWVHVLFDYGASYSFISTSCVKSLGLECDPLETILCVASPLGGNIRVRLICRGCELEVSGLHLSCNLRVMNMSDFDIILGMDWLFAHRTVIDCYHKRVTVCTPSGTCFQFKRDREDSLSTTNRKMQWHQQFARWLASLIINEEVQSELNLPRVVCEYTDVFPEELPGLPPHRDVDFSIELQAGTAPISLTLHRMAPAELQELKTQLQELLEKGFIRPSTSPWGAPVLFAKKKDGTLRLCIDYRQLNRDDDQEPISTSTD